MIFDSIARVKTSEKPASPLGLEARRLASGSSSSEKSGRYGKRAKEVAARTVMKHHKEEGHKKGE